MARTLPAATCADLLATGWDQPAFNAARETPHADLGLQLDDDQSDVDRSVASIERILRRVR